MPGWVMKAGIAGLTLLGACGTARVPEDLERPRPVVGELPLERRILRWRLVERSFAIAHPTQGIVGDGLVPPSEKTLVFEPVYEDSCERVKEEAGFRLRSLCEHEVIVTVRGSRARPVGERVTAECRIATSDGVTHEIAIEPNARPVEILEVRGATAAAGTPRRYLVQGSNEFSVVFTSRVAGQSGVEISVVREVDELSRGRDSTASPRGAGLPSSRETVLPPLSGGN